MMLEIDMEFRKGILFVRLIGKLTNNTVGVLNKEVTNVVKDYGIGNIVFNVSGLIEIDVAGMEALINNYKVTTTYQGKTIVCGLENSVDMKKRMKKNHLFDYLFETSDELSALHYFSH